MLSGGFKVEGYDDYTFRVRKLNAFEVLGLQTQINFDEAEKAERFFKLCLECLEVECKGVWLPCKEKKVEVYAPAEIEDNVDLLKKVISEFTNNYLTSVFMRSGESNNEQAFRSPDEREIL